MDSKGPLRLKLNGASCLKAGATLERTADPHVGAKLSQWRLWSGTQAQPGMGNSLTENSRGRALDPVAGYRKWEASSTSAGGFENFHEI